VGVVSTAKPFFKLANLSSILPDLPSFPLPKRLANLVAYSSACRLNAGLKTGTSGFEPSPWFGLISSDSDLSLTSFDLITMLLSESLALVSRSTQVNVRPEATNVSLSLSWLSTRRPYASGPVGSRCFT
jgi:hypothetical protein